MRLRYAHCVIALDAFSLMNPYDIDTPQRGLCPYLVLFPRIWDRGAVGDSILVIFAVQLGRGVPALSSWPQGTHL